MKKESLIHVSVGKHRRIFFCLLSFIFACLLLALLLLMFVMGL
jgi:hypothetical protein